MGLRVKTQKKCGLYDTLLNWVGDQRSQENIKRASKVWGEF